jgi:hypothetical protein
MMMHTKTLASALTLLLSLAPLQDASAATTTYVFEAVDSYDIGGMDNTVSITGIIQGEATPRTVTLSYEPYSGSTTNYAGSKRTFERCERLLLLAMAKPGQYLLEMRHEELYGSEYIGCKLTRR